MSLTPERLTPELSVRDFATSLEFYTQVSGFTVRYERPEEGFAFLELGDATLMIDELGLGWDWQTAALEYPLGRGVNFQIMVAELDPLLERLHRAGVKLFAGVEEKWYRKDQLEVGNRQFLVQDSKRVLAAFRSRFRAAAVDRRAAMKIDLIENVPNASLVLSARNFQRENRVPRPRGSR